MSLSQRISWCSADVNPCWSHHLNKETTNHRSPPSSAVVFTAMRLNQPHFYCSANFVLLFCLHRRSNFSQRQAKYTWFVPSFWVMWICVSLDVYACLYESLYKMSMCCRCWQLKQLILCSSLRPCSLNTLSCGAQLWRDWWAPLNHLLTWLACFTVLNTLHGLLLHHITPITSRSSLRAQAPTLIKWGMMTNVMETWSVFISSILNANFVSAVIHLSHWHH